MESDGAYLGVAIFMAAWIAGVASWFLGVAESIGMWKFKRWVFSRGFVALSEDRVIPNPSDRLPLGEIIKTENGKFLLINPNECLYRSQFRSFSFKIHTPFPLKGSIRWNGDQAHIRARMPIFTILFMAAWLVGWTAGSVMSVASGGEGAGAGISFLLFGFAAVIGMTAFSLPLEKRRSRALVQELEALITSPAA